MSRHAVVFFAVLALTALVYWPGLHGPLVFDDQRNLEPLVQWLDGRLGWSQVVFGNESGRLGRQVSMASFVLSAMVSGTDIWGFKLANLLLHLINGVLVYLFMERLLRLGALTRELPASARWLPVLGSAVWLLHPLLVSTVLYVVQRMAMLSAMFTLLAMIAYLHGRVALMQGQTHRAWWLMAFGMPACTLLATLSKENGVLAPALCALMELFAFAPPIGKRRPWSSTAFIALTLVAPALAGLSLVLARSPIITTGYQDLPFTLVDRLLTQPRVLWDYIAALVMPYGPRLGLYHDDYIVSHGLLDPASTVLALLGWAAAFALAWRMRRSVPGLALGLGMFLVGQALESTAFPLLMYFEHRNYLPAVGLVWALLALGTFAAVQLQRHMHHGGAVFATGAVALVLVLGLATAARANVWRTQQALLAQGLANHPDSRWLRTDLAYDAVNRSPPDTKLARRQTDYLQSAAQPSTRRLGAVLRLLIDCKAGIGARASSKQDAFGGHAATIEADLLVASESLAEGAIQSPCDELTPTVMAPALARMLDRSTLPANNLSVWRLRFKAAKLYSAAGNNDDALRQAKLAYAGGTASPAVPVFIAALLLQRDDTLGATRMLDAAERGMMPGDAQGQAIVKQYRAEIRNRTQ